MHCIIDQLKSSSLEAMLDICFSSSPSGLQYSCERKRGPRTPLATRFRALAINYSSTRGVVIGQLYLSVRVRNAAPGPWGLTVRHI